ncbi:phosphatidylinositol-specific phospholipase C [Glaciimonas sp. GG7]
MKIKHYISALAISLFSTALQAHTDSAYSHNASDGFTKKERWMESIRDDVKLSELALPGTHDSGTFKLSNIHHLAKTQSLNFKEQLEYGIRVFDIRVRHTSNRFALHHGVKYLDVMFGDTLLAVSNFLDKNPTETVLIRVKTEHDNEANGYINKTNTRSPEETFKYYLNIFRKHHLNTNRENITLGEARGKYIILGNGGPFEKHGILYHNLLSQDYYDLKTNWDLYDKWIKVKNHLWEATKGDENRIYVNYLSAAGGIFPYFVASGHSSPGTSAPRLATGLTTPGWSDSYPDFPRVDCIWVICTIAFEGTNILTRNTISTINIISEIESFASLFGIKRSVGIIMADFPGESLISNIITNNKLTGKMISKSGRSIEADNAQEILLQQNNTLNILEQDNPDLHEKLMEQFIATQP